MRNGRVVGAGVCLGLGAFWLPLVGGIAPTGAAGAAGSRPAAVVRGASSSPPKLVARRLPVKSVLRSARTTEAPAIQGASLGGPAPVCYGDTRSIAPQGGPLDPATFGGLYNCNKQEWTFEVTTTNGFSSSVFGAWAVGIFTDAGVFCSADNLYWPEYDAVFEQVSPGRYANGMLEFDPTNCMYDKLVGALTQDALTATGASLSFTSAEIGGRSTLAWSGQLATYAEVQKNQQGDVVPSPTFIDDVAEGLVLDSVPPSANPPQSCGEPATPQTTEVATTRNSARAAAALRRAGFRNVHDYGEGIVSFAGGASPARAALSAAGLAASISPEHLRYAESLPVNSPDDPDYPSQWNLSDVNAPGAWAVTTGSSNVIVADVDTGVDFNQTDLVSPKLVDGEDETQSPPQPMNYASGQDDATGHGTAVAGVIGADTDNGNEVASLGWNTSIMPIKASDGDTFTTAAIAASVDYAVANGAKVINLSVGGPCPDATEQTAIENAVSAGVLVVASAGNGALNSSVDPSNGQDDYYTYPAAYSLDYPSGVIAVGATGVDGYRAAYSNTGPYVSMVAPGGNVDNASDCITVLDYLNNSGTDCEAGTSFAAPQVAAAAALVWSANPNLTASQVRELLEGTATSTGPSGYNIEYGNGMLNANAALADTPPTTAGYGTFTSLPPVRILDTRTSLGGHDGPLNSHSTLQLQVTGEGGVPSSGVAAVVLNITILNPVSGGYLTVWPDGQSRPETSNISYAKGETILNLVTVKVGPTGLVDFYNDGGPTEVLAEVSGYYEDGTQAQAGSTYMPRSPVRVMDTRQSGGPLGPGTFRSLQVAGTAYVPSTATAVVLNVTALQPTATSYLTIYPSGQARPVTLNLYFSKGEMISNLVTVKVPASGIITIYNAAGSVQVLADLQGYFTAQGDMSGSRFFPVVDHRILDTRANIGGYDAPIGPRQVITVHVVGAGGVIDGAVAGVMNATVIGPTEAGYLTAYPAGAARPVTANITFSLNETIAGLLPTELGAGEMNIFGDGGDLNLVDDVAGWYGPAGS